MAAALLQLVELNSIIILRRVIRVVFSLFACVRSARAALAVTTVAVGMMVDV